MGKLAYGAVVALLGAGMASAAPCVTTTVHDYIALGATGCEIGSLTFIFDSTKFIPFSAVASGGVHLFLDTEVNLTPISDANGVGFEVDPLIAMATSPHTGRTDIDLKYLVKTTNGQNSITGIYAQVDGSATGGTPAAFASVVEVYCAGGTSLPPDQLCPGNNPPGAAKTIITSTSAHQSFNATNFVAVDKDIDANALNGGSATINFVRNQFVVPEPSTTFLFGGGLAFILAAFIRKRRSA